MKSLFSFALAAGLLLAVCNDASAFRPGGFGTFRPSPPRPRPPQLQAAFPTIDQLDESACAALAKAMTAPEAAKNMKALARKGGELRGIRCLPRRNSEEQTLEFTFQSVGNPFQPSQPKPWKATFTVQMFLPQDAGWQIGEVSAVTTR